VLSTIGHRACDLYSQLDWYWISFRFSSTRLFPKKLCAISLVNLNVKSSQIAQKAEREGRVSWGAYLRNELIKFSTSAELGKISCNFDGQVRHNECNWDEVGN